MELLWTKEKLDPCVWGYAEAFHDVVPSFQCAAGLGEDVTAILRGYFFIKGFRQAYEIYALGCQLELGKKKTFIAKSPETKERITALYLLAQLLKETEEKDKKDASIRVIICPPLKISEKLIESRFNSMKYLLAYLAKQAIGENGELSEEMQHLESINIRVIYC